MKYFQFLTGRTNFVRNAHAKCHKNEHDVLYTKPVWNLTNWHTVNLLTMVDRVASLLLLPWLLVEVYCQQTVSYASFMGQTLANHSYVDLSLVRNDGSGSDSVQCC